MAAVKLADGIEKTTRKVTFLSIIKACGTRGDLSMGRMFHGYIAQNLTVPNMFIGNTLLGMYANCGSIQDARQVFDRLPDRNVVSWTAMIAACTKLGYSKEALKIYQQMELEGVLSNEVTFVCMLQACTELHALKQGKRLHAQICTTEFLPIVEVCNSLVSMYMKCGCVENARFAFDKCTLHDVVSWNALIIGYVQHGNDDEAFKLYYSMESEGFNPDQVTFLATLNACGTLAALELGKRLHVEVMKAGFELEVEVVNTLINMYAKCGCLEIALHLFERLPRRNVVSWSVMTAAYAQHGSGLEALELVDQMQQDGYKKDYIAFVSMLTACSHSGLIERGYFVLYSMQQDYGVKPAEEHYACMVDLLGRAGCLQEVEVLVRQMSFTPSLNLWRALLGSCKIHGNIILAKWAVQSILALEPGDTAASLMLSNIFCTAGEENFDTEDSFW